MKMNATFICYRKRLVAAVSSVIAGTGNLHADGIEEVIVTANKREQSLQDIPMAVTAFTSEQIVQRGFDQFSDYTKFIPGLSSGDKQPGGTSIVFRGVASTGVQIEGRASSCLYLDEQPITISGNNPDPRLVDVQRIEALKGPQATLYGDSCQSGALKIVSNKPHAENFEGWMEVSGNKVKSGRDGGFDFSGMANLPINDQLAIRLSGFYTEEAGYIDNVARPSPGGTFSSKAEKDVNDTKVQGARGVLRWNPDEDLTVDASAMFQDTELDGFGDTNLDVGDLEQLRYIDEIMDDEWYQLGLTIEANLGWADAVVSGSYFDREFRYDADTVEYQFDFAAGSPYYDFGADTQNGTSHIHNERDAWSIEARLSTPTDLDSRWRGIVGLFYSNAKNESFFTVSNDSISNGSGETAAYLSSIAPPGIGPSPVWYSTLRRAELENTALFGEVNYRVTDALTITLGGRYYEVDETKKDLVGALNQSLNTLSPATDLITGISPGKSDDEGFLSKINFEYRIDEDKMIYATYSEGFRSGGSNTGRPATIFAPGGSHQSYDADTIDNYEIGAKTTWFDERLNINLSVFHMDWNDIQLRVVDPTGASFQQGIVNFAAAEIDGAEISINWSLSANLLLGGDIAYLDAAISDADEGPTVIPKGTRLPLSPDWKVTAWGEYNLETEWFGSQPWARLDIAHIGDSVSSTGGAEAFLGEPQVQGDYTVVNLHAGLRNDGWSLSVSLENIWDERAEVFFNNRYQKLRQTVNQPRTFKVTLRKYF